MTAPLRFFGRAGRAPKNDPAIFALALAASLGDLDTKRLAVAAIPKVCRTGTHLFQFAEIIRRPIFTPSTETIRR